MNQEPLKPDAPFYTEDELDALYESDPVAALRISREQHALRQQLGSQRGEAGPAPTADGIKEVLAETRRILLRDGGDLEFVALEGTVVQVRLKGNCAGCPRATLDLKNIVEQMVKNRFPQITAVRNVF
ncbi:MAG: NifU family protein [Betaproteobacteria bacterium]|nr:NifU family protein [Betaproteobacteria bacterium]MBI2293541.1 NifU family protein [Betaproteobacteria bacterium]MBI3054124.1 NifU family protein [Betaproteobacteria bacterium]